MVDLALDQEEALEAVAFHPPRYPYGLCISLCEKELDKLDIHEDELSVGSVLHLHCMAKVTSISERDDAVCGPTSRVELQITHIASESEDEENEKYSVSRRVSKLYKD